MFDFGCFKISISFDKLQNCMPEVIGDLTIVILK